MKNKTLIVLCSAACFWAVMTQGACSLALLEPSAVGIFQRQDSRIMEKNYAAADYLVQQAHTYIDRSDTVKALPLMDADEPQLETVIGKVIPEQVGLRLAQLGYRMDISAVSTTGDQEYLRTTVLEGGRRPEFVLSGRYTRKARDLLVSLRITEVKTGVIISAFDYTLPMTEDVGKGTTAEPKIIRLTPPPASPATQTP